MVDRSAAPASRSRSLVLAAMIFAVSMTFIDQTIVSIAIPKIQHELGLTSTGAQWVINSYLLTLAALFAFGGRLADIVGHGRMVVIGVLVFAGSSVLCGFTPTGSAAEGWIVTFRAFQGAGGAIMFPAALAIVVATFPLRDRGKALALFFGIASGLTAIGPVLGGVLTEWTWRAIFWVNVPVAVIALALVAVSKPESEHRPTPIDYRGLVLIAGGVGLSVFGFQQASIWGWHNPAIGACIAAGALLLVVFTRVELRTEAPLIEMRIFSIRAFLVENLVLGVSMLSFVPLFFIASEYAQISLGKSSSNAGIYLLYFFIGFAVASQIGGRRLDRAGAKRPVVLGCALAAAGFALWAGKATQLSIGAQEWYVVLAGGGMGLMLGPASTDAVNRASRLSYGEATGITQTVRNYAASLGMAVLGTVLVTQFRSELASSLIRRGVSAGRAEGFAASASQGGHGASTSSIPHFVRLDFAHATQTVLFAMAGIMAVAAVVALLGLEAGVQEEVPEATGETATGETAATVAPTS